MNQLKIMNHSVIYSTHDEPGKSFEQLRDELLEQVRIIVLIQLYFISIGLYWEKRQLLYTHP